METFFKENILLTIIYILWTLPWKAYALWTASREKHKRWFIALLILNTFAIVDIFYLFYVAKKDVRDIKKLFTTKI
jgi:hypothetical protein